MDVAVHSQDHAYDQIMTFLPEVYQSSILSTLEDRDVYCEHAGLRVFEEEKRMLNRLILSSIFLGRA